VLFLGSIGWLVPTVNTYFTTVHATATADARGTAIIGGHVTVTAEVRATVIAAAQAYAAGTTQQGVMFGFDSAHTHWKRYERVLNVSTLSRLKPLWSYATRGSFYFDSSPAIANGMLYISSHDSKLYAFGLAG
jgi:outer membrane protein assembly factor BamB